MQASIERLTDELVKIGMGEREPEHMVTVERQLRPSRSRSQELMLVRTGQKLELEQIQVAGPQAKAK